MTIAFGAIGAKSAGGTTTISVAHPASVGAGDLLIAGRVSWNVMTHTAEAGWNLSTNTSGGTGTAADAHTTRASISTREAAGGETGSVTFDQAGTASGAMGVMARYTKAAGTTWSIQGALSGNDATHGANRSILSNAMNLAPGDVIVAVVATDTDAALTITSPTFTATGITFGTPTRRTPATAGVTTGTDGNVEIFDVEVVSGSAVVNVTFEFTTATSQCGPVAFVRLRETVPWAAHPTSHASSPVAVKTTNATLTTASFDPPARVAFVAGLTSDATNNSGTAPSISSTAGAAITWTLVEGAGYTGEGGDVGMVAIWQGVLADPDNNLGSITVTATPGSSAQNSKMLIVRVYDETEVDISDPIGAVAKGAFGAGITTVSGSVTPETTGGGIRLAYLDWNATGPPVSYVPDDVDTNLVDVYHAAGLSTNVQLAKAVQTVAGVSQTIGANLISAASDGNWIAYELRAPSAGTNYPRSQSESVVVTDTVARAAPKARSTTDTDPPVTDTVARAVAQARSTSDSATVSDATVPTPTQNRAIADTASASDTVARASTRNRALAETDPPVTDTVAQAAATRSRAVTDTAAVTDATVPLKGRQRGQADTAAVSDTTARSPQALSRTTAETRSVTDTVARASTRQRSAGETAAVGEATTPASARARAVGDAADVSDDAVRAAQPLARGVADSAAVSEIVGSQGTRSRAVIDSVSAADTTAPGLARSRTTSDSASATDTTAQTASRARAITETRSVSDAVVRRVNRPRSQTEADPPVTDTVARAAATRSRAVTESVAVTDTSSASTTGQLSRGISENVAVSDTVARAAGAKQRGTTEADPPVTDTVARLAPKTRGLAEADPPVTDTVARGTSRSRAVSDATLAFDTSAIGVHRARATSEAAEILESVASVFSIARGVLDSAALADLSRAGTVQAREVLESIGVTDVSVLIIGVPNEYDLVVGPAVETFRVAAAAVPFTVGAVPVDVVNTEASDDYVVRAAPLPYFVRSAR